MSMFIRIRGRVHGPLSEAQITQMIQQGKAGKFNDVSPDGKTWKRASEYPELFPQKISRRDPDELALADDNAPQNTGNTSGELWYLSNDGITGTGPFSVGEIKSMLANGKASTSSFVWQEGESAKPLGEVSRFRDSTPGESLTTAREHTNEAKTKKCCSCHQDIALEAAFCYKCGAAQTQETKQAPDSPLKQQVRCKSCRFVLEPGATYCPQCGAEQEEGEPRSRLVYMLLALLLLGGFGAHNFYADRKSAAARQLVLGLSLVGFVVSFVWAIIDVINVHEDGQGVPFTE
ncbi:MAG: GYF domain-containing protein [Thermoguttaceae bacterium]|nr:GYF domain-containing protein [Thermoguttaceae bacterium]